MTISRPLFRRKPSRRYKTDITTPGILLKEIGVYEIGPAYFLHQIHGPSVALFAAQDYLPKEYLFGAEAFIERLAKHTRWQAPCSFVQRALERSEVRSEPPGREHHSFDHGFAWRLFVVHCYPEVWQTPPTLSDFRRDVETTQQAILYHPNTALAVLQRMSDKYDEGLWIVGEHYTSWHSLLPARRDTWKQLADDLETTEGDDRLSDQLHWVDMVCEHILHELRVHEARLKKDGTSKGGLSGRTGDALLAKVVEECRYQWQWSDGTDPIKEFKSFYRLVMGAMDAIAPPNFKETTGTAKTVKRYLRLFIDDDNGFGRVRWSEAETLPGAKKSQFVLGHSYSVYPYGKRYWWPRLKIQLKAWLNILRGYPPTIDNHDRTW